MFLFTTKFTLFLRKYIKNKFFKKQEKSKFIFKLIFYYLKFIFFMILLLSKFE